MNFSEAQLIDELKKGNKEGFTLLFEQFSIKIYGLAFRMCGNKEDAEDIVQRTFVQVITGINGFREESSLYTWIYSIAKNLCLRVLEDRKRSSFTSLEELLRKSSSPESFYDFSALEKQYYIQQVKDGCLLGLLRCLSLYQRIAFILNVLLDVKVKTVAMVVNKSENATRLLIHRAKRNLKNFLCRNCSFYDESNPCHCENLIHFSMEKGWIQRIDKENVKVKSDNKLISVENEISDLEKVVRIYKSLEEQPPENSITILQELIKRQPYQIFNDKKVK